MIIDPVVIRICEDRFLIASNEPSDPVHLIRQSGPDELEVHLQNGSTYKQKTDNISNCILELLGYTKKALVIEFNAWPSCYEGDLNFEDLDTQKLGERELNKLIKPVPFLPRSRFVDSKITILKTISAQSDFKKYKVRIELIFWARPNTFSQIHDMIDAEDDNSVSNLIYRYLKDTKFEVYTQSHKFYWREI